MCNRTQHVHTKLVPVRLAGVPGKQWHRITLTGHLSKPTSSWAHLGKRSQALGNDAS